MCWNMLVESRVSRNYEWMHKLMNFGMKSMFQEIAVRMCRYCIEMNQELSMLMKDMEYIRNWLPKKMILNVFKYKSYCARSNIYFNRQKSSWCVVNVPAGQTSHDWELTEQEPAEQGIHADDDAPDISPDINKQESFYITQCQKVDKKEKSDENYMNDILYIYKYAVLPARHG